METIGSRRVLVVALQYLMSYILIFSAASNAKCFSLSLYSVFYYYYYSYYYVCTWKHAQVKLCLYYIGYTDGCVYHMCRIIKHTASIGIGRWDSNAGVHCSSRLSACSGTYRVLILTSLSILTL